MLTGRDDEQRSERVNPNLRLPNGLTLPPLQIFGVDRTRLDLHSYLHSKNKLSICSLS